MRLWLGHPFYSPEANGGGAPVNPFSPGGPMTERETAARVPTADRVVRGQGPPASETPPPKRPEPDSPPAEKPEPAPAPETPESEPPEREVPATEEATPDEPAEGSEEPRAAAGEEEYPEVVQKLLGKFGDVAGLAEGYVDLRGLQSKTAEKLKQALELVEPGPDGKFVVRADKASERLRQMRGGESVDYDSLVQEIPLDYVEKHVERQWREAWAAQGHDADGIAELLEQNKPMLKAHAQSEHARVKGELERRRQTSEGRTRQIIAEHLRSSPGDEKLLKPFQELMDTLPLSIGMRIVNEGAMGGVKRIFKFLRAEADYAADIKAAYNEGKKRGKLEVDATPGSPPAGGKGPAKQRAKGEDQELRAWKDQLVNPRQSTLERMGLS